MDSFLVLQTFDGIVNWTVGFIATAGVFAILALALNMQWGAGILNFGVVAFFMVGAYVTAIITLDAPRGTEDYIGGFGLPTIAGIAAAGVGGAVLALLLAVPTIRLREDFLAIATIGVAEILRSTANSIEGLVNRSRGLTGIPRIAGHVVEGEDYRWLQLAIVLVAVAVVFFFAHRAEASPWGRVLRAVRDNEDTARASGKNTVRFRMQAFVIGGVLMAIAGAIWAHRQGAISPPTFSDVIGTFFVWAILIVGGSGNNRGALVGALVVSFFWFGTPLIQESLPDWLGTRVFQIRQILVGLLIVGFLLWRPQGLIPERQRVSRYLAREPAAPGAAPRRFGFFRSRPPEPPADPPGGAEPGAS